MLESEGTKEYAMKGVSNFTIEDTDSCCRGCVGG